MFLRTPKHRNFPPKSFASCGYISSYQYPRNFHPIININFVLCASSEVVYILSHWMTCVNWFLKCTFIKNLVECNNKNINKPKQYNSTKEIKRGHKT